MNKMVYISREIKIKVREREREQAGRKVVEENY
jgi:hypothetical protein